MDVRRRLRYLTAAAQAASPAFAPHKHTAFDNDQMASGAREVNKYARCIVDYATHVHILMSSTARTHAIVHCKNSRSRSPSVLLAYMVLFCGIPIANARIWLTAAFTRPVVQFRGTTC